MKKAYLVTTLTGVFAVAMFGSSQAATININEIPDTVEYVDSISTFNTTGLYMADMEVTVVYEGGGSDTVSWDSSGAGTGAVGNGWSLYMDDPAQTTYYGSFWVFDVTGTSIESIFLDGFDNNVIFDNDGVNFGTVGSRMGSPLGIDFGNLATTTYTDVIDVFYIGDIAITGTSVYGDVYQSMLIDFTGSAFTSKDVFEFYQDTDNISNPIPEPATMLLFGVGVTGLLGMCSRRKRK